MVESTVQFEGEGIDILHDVIASAESHARAASRLATENAELRRSREIGKKNLETLIRAISDKDVRYRQLEAQLAKARESLKFYADEKHLDVAKASACFFHDKGKCISERGDVAREALSAPPAASDVVKNEPCATEYHGCLTGDCPHTKREECEKDIRAALGDSCVLLPREVARKVADNVQNLHWFLTNMGFSPNKYDIEVLAILRSAAGKAGDAP